MSAHTDDDEAQPRRAVRQNPNELLLNPQNDEEDGADDDNEEPKGVQLFDFDAYGRRGKRRQVQCAPPVTFTGTFNYLGTRVMVCQ